ncbi:MAG TPA: xylulokinase [Candidatus Gemmiger excrementavium]|uniref:Xylulose kinase n=1 Tax=Candidatus Gemmiger excrementavium TaxID=2838608 RepID=A0A9D2F1H7_9FIRM|nr:xylulokinase [Candidatus Gemmiger excrementavium]
MLYIGVDLGTSACKFLLVDDQGRVCHQVTRDYPLCMPRPGWSEQDPALWWKACLDGIPALLAGFDPAQVQGIGVGGQMHGLVALDGDGAVLRPAILWNDGRTAAETDYLNTVVGRKTLSQYTGNIAFAGFTAPKLLWMQKHEPELYARIAKILLPKDYLVYKMTGAFSTDYSDASGMLLLDVEHKCWSKEMCELCGVQPEWLAGLYESWQPVGTLRPDVAAALGLPETVKVCAGAGDNAAAAVGTGTVGPGRCNISLGTSGTLFISSDTFGVDATNGLHAFAHADGGWHLMGCMLSAASCNKWWMDDILNVTDRDYPAEQAPITRETLGRNPVFFLPYLMGERSPINDTDARGVFLGMSMDTTRADMTQAVLEGVAFALRDSFEVARSLGIAIPRSNLCGGGAKSPLWGTILANVLGIPLDILVTEQGPGYGGALLAMVCCGQFADVQQAADALVRVSRTIEPDAELTARYEERYQKYKQIYPACRPLFKQLAQ